MWNANLSQILTNSLLEKLYLVLSWVAIKNQQILMIKNLILMGDIPEEYIFVTICSVFI